MRKLPGIAVAALSVAALAGTAVAAMPNSHVIDVSLPDGSSARVEYVGDIAPKVTILPAEAADADWLLPPEFFSFDRMIASMNRQSEAMMREASQIARQPAALGNRPAALSFGTAPGAMSSTTVISYSNGSGTCTRTTQAVSQGPNKPAKVTTSVTGNCAATATPGQPVPSSAPPVSRT